MASLLDAVGAQAKNSFCNLTSPLDRALELGENLYNDLDVPGFPDGPTPLGQGLVSARDLLCNEPPRDVSGNFDEPFSGGQCVGTDYEVVTQSKLNGANFGGQVTTTGPGPVSKTKEIGGNGDLVIAIKFGDGSTGGNISSQPDNNPSLEVISITPLGGGPDNCGDPPEELPDPYVPDRFEDNPNVTYTPPSGPDVTVPVSLIFAPVVINNQLDFEVPVKVNINAGVDINGTLNLNTGDFSVNTSIDIDVPSPIDDPSIEPDPTGPSGTPPTSLELPETSIIGVFVQVTDLGSSGLKRAIFNPGMGVTIYGPRLASVTFHCELLSVPGLAWTQDIDVKYTEQIVYCPVPWGAKSVEVSPIPGVVLNYSLITAESERSLLLRAAGVQAESQVEFD